MTRVVCWAPSVTLGLVGATATTGGLMKFDAGGRLSTCQLVPPSVDLTTACWAIPNIVRSRAYVGENWIGADTGFS
jgi:hypothetical protein